MVSETEIVESLWSIFYTNGYLDLFQGDKSFQGYMVLWHFREDISSNL